MNNLVILTLQFLIAIATYILIFRVYFRDWFAAKPFGQAVLPLLLLHAFRYLGLVVLVPGQIDPSVPQNALQNIAWGDFASGVAGLSAALAVHRGWPVATALVGLFSLVGIGDLVTVGFTANEAGLFFADIGATWFLTVVYAPVMLLAQGYIAYRLILHLAGETREA